MQRMKDRLRLKDRILEDIAKAIRLIQDTQSRSENELLVLTNSDWQLHKLVGHLDHAFLHGLRHVTNGYWILVQEFTHKSTVKDIQLLNNVTTNLGRGRAWLYQALNDKLLESYTKCYLDNKQLVKKYYVKEALVLDEQRLQILVTLVSGLEMTYFQLEVDVPYLDLVSCIRLKSSESDESEDRLSLSSQDSSFSQGSSCAQDPFDESKIILPSRGQRSFSIGYVENKQKIIHSSMSLPVMRYDMTSQSDYVDPVEQDSGNGKIEVIHLTGKNRKKKTSGKRLRSECVFVVEPENLDSTQSPECKEKPVTSEQSSGTVTPTTPESGYRSTIENRLSWQQDSVSECESVREEVTLNNNRCNKNEPDSVPSEKALMQNDKSEGISPDSLQGQAKSQPMPVLIQVTKDLNWTPKELHLVQSLSEISVLELDADSKIHSAGADKLDSNELCVHSGVVPLESDPPVDCDSKSEMPESLSKEDNSSPGVSLQNSEQSIYDDDGNDKTFTDPDGSADQSGNVHDPAGECGPSEASSQSETASSGSHNSSNVSSQSTVDADEQRRTSTLKVRKTKKRSEGKHSKESGRVKKDHDAEVIVDNNLMLLLMLEVFEVEEEKLIKMYQTCIGHTEGAVVPVYVLLSDSALYLLTTKYGQKKFKKEGRVKYRELDYVSLSLNYQIINVVCTNRRKQFWITTGDEELTRCIVSHLELALRKCETSLSPLSVLADATTQKIAIKKWLAAECKTEMTDVNIIQYRLTNWEDLDNDDSACIVPTTNKEGLLYYKTEPGLFFASYWKEAYFVLKDGFLCQYADRHDNQPPKLTIQLNQEDCVGCRHCCVDERQNCFELILASGTTLQLSAASETESREWLQSLCKAISQGTGLSTGNTGLLPCCAVLTSTHIFLFHEDVETNFCRTLASAQLTDLVNVQLDPGAQIYMILMIQSQVVQSYCRRWVLYFNTVPERDSFLSHLSKVWASHFQVKLPKMPLSDVKIRAKCRTGIGRLKKQRRV